ncbi:MAG: c-type cytochrome [Myxococcales bacterium]|nr:c-type cytochrome [Myxococcales bacterium]
MRLRRIAVALGTLTAASVLAHAERVAARKMMMSPRDLAPPSFALGGRPLTAAPAPAGLDAAQAAYLSGSAIAVVGAQALVIDADSGDLVLTGADGAPTARLAIGTTATQLVFDPVTHRAYVASRGTDEIIVVEVGASLTIAGRWRTPTEPYGLALTPDRTMLLTTTVAARTLVAFDVATGKERWRRALAPDPRGVAIDPDGSTALVTSLVTGAVERIELATPQAGTSVSLSPAVSATGNPFAASVVGQLGGGSESGRGHARNAFAARFIGADLALVAHQTSIPLQDARFGENTGSYGGGFEPPIKHQVTFIATGARASRSVTAQIADHQPKAIAWDPVRDRAFVVGYGSDSLLVLGAAGQAGVRFDRTVAVGAEGGCGPEGVAVGADGTAWVFCAVSRKVVRVPMDGEASTATVGAVAVAPTRMSKQAHEGFDLFRKGNDGRISSRGAMACSSCHPEAGTDGLSWRIESHELQTPLLAGRVAGTHPYKWDGGDRDLAISLTSTMRRLGGAGLTPGQTKSLAAYLEALPRPRTIKRDPTAVARGQALFESDEVGCTTCHGGPLYTDNVTHELGGTLAQSDTPSLVGLARSAPYYHDGSAATLEALLAERATVHGMSETASLTAGERRDLIAYLETL